MRTTQKSTPLTPGQLALVDQYLARWPRPELYVRKKHPACWRALLASGLTADDAYAEAVLGLAAAARKFDAGRGARFSTYATWWVRARIGRAVRDWSFRQRKLGPKVHADRRVPGDRSSRSLWDVLGLSDPRAPDPGEDDRRAQLRARVADAFRFLDRRKRAILVLRFGLDPRAPEPLTLDQVGTILGVTRERVRQLEARAFDAVRDRLMFAEGLTRELRRGGRIARPTPTGPGAAACPTCGAEFPNSNYRRCLACKPYRPDPTRGGPA